MKLKSNAFKNEGNIPSRYTCDGDDVSPPLSISGAPKGTKSLVLMVDDPDVPKSIRNNELWVHWTVWSINPDIEDVEEGSVPDGGVEGITDFGRPGYGGPCPPDGEHRYFFKLYALDTDLNLQKAAKKPDILAAMEDHVLDKCELIGLYNRK